MADIEQNSSESQHTSAVTEEMMRGGVEKGAKTSDFFRIKNMPDRFNNPDIYVNAGNPIFTCRDKVPSLSCPPHRDDEWFQGYECKKQNPMYMTTSSDIGGRPPTVFTMPTTFNGRSQKFTGPLGKCGMYRNHSLNTSSDKSII